MTGWHMRIGEAAERVGLSIRTIRHYEDAAWSCRRRAARTRVRTLRERLATAEGFAQQLQNHIDLHNR